MAYNYLNQALSQFSGVSSGLSYIFPTVQKLNAGKYVSEILDVQDVVDSNGKLLALDFYHKLADSNDNVIHVRFRFYAKELPSLVSSLKQYPQVKTWKNVVGLQEEVTVAPKPAGSYMHIAARKASISNVAQPASGASSTSSQPPKRVGIAPSAGSKRGNMPSPTPKPSLLSEDDEFDDWEDDSDEE